MTVVRVAHPDDVRIILCLKFLASATHTDVTDLKQALVACERVVHGVDSSGSFDFMVEIACEHLHEYQALIDDLADLFDRAVDHYEVSFICRRYLCDPAAANHCFWVPSGRGRLRIDHRQIDMVSAEGDYVRLHCGGRSWMLHQTMKGVRDALDPAEFVQVNRSLIVRTDVIARLDHGAHGWTIELTDGSAHRIARSRLHEVQQILRSQIRLPRDPHDSSMKNRAPAMPQRSVDIR